MEVDESQLLKKIINMKIITERDFEEKLHMQQNTKTKRQQSLKKTDR
jgi:hypothetical protein